MSAFTKFSKNKGFSVIEVLIAVSLITIVFIDFLGIVSFSLKSEGFIKKAVQADALAQEAMEAIRNFRDGSTWSDGLGSLSVDVDYQPVLAVATPSSWSFVLGQETIGNFTRKVVFQEVSRDPTTGRIEQVYNADHNDLKTRKAIVTISFDSKTVQLTSYFTDWQNNE